jgi:hypothetical protein
MIWSEDLVFPLLFALTSLQFAPPDHAGSHDSRIEFRLCKLAARDYHCLCNLLRQSTEIRVLELDSTETNTYNLCMVMYAIGACSTVTDFVIAYNGVNEPSLRALGSALHRSKTLTRIYVGQCARVSPSGMEAFCNHLAANPMLTTLAINSCGLDVNDVHCIARALASNTHT